MPPGVNNKIFHISLISLTFSLFLVIFKASNSEKLVWVTGYEND